MKFFDKIKGLGNLSALIGNPAMVLQIGVDAMPGIAHTIGRARLATRLAFYASALAETSNQIIVGALTGKRDVTPDELLKLTALHKGVIDAAHAIHTFPQNVSILSLSQAFGIAAPQPSDQGATASLAVAADEGASGIGA